MSKVNEYLDARLEFTDRDIILDLAIDSIVEICCDRMFALRGITSPAHEWLCFNNLLELIRNRAMERLEKEDYFK